jgi:glycosyltransferase involved in cell wall biosynthesis
VLYLGLSLGLPVVATRIGAWAEMLRDGENALLVPPESPAALGEAIVRALGEPALRESLAQGGRELAEEHSWPSIAGQTERAFNALKR